MFRKCGQKKLLVTADLQSGWSPFGTTCQVGFRAQMGLLCQVLQRASGRGLEPLVFHALLALFRLPYLLPLSPSQKAAFQDANVCLFVFDCIYFNDVSLMDR